MYNVNNGTSLAADRGVKGSTGQRVRKGLSAARSTTDVINSATSLLSTDAIDKGNAPDVADYLSDSVDDGDDEDLGSEEVQSLVTCVLDMLIRCIV